MKSEFTTLMLLPLLTSRPLPWPVPSNFTLSTVRFEVPFIFSLVKTACFASLAEVMVTLPL